MKSIYCYKKRQELKAWIKDTSILIKKLKDCRKTVRPRIYPDFVRPKGIWLETVQSDFRHKHIAASMIRGKTLVEIEHRSSRPNKVYVRPDMGFVNRIMEGCLDENVCIGAENPVEVTAGSASGPCPG